MAGLPERNHARQEGHDRIHDATDVHAHDPVPVVEGGVLHETKDADAGVVHQHLHRTEYALGFVRGGDEPFAIRDVELDGVHLLVRGASGSTPAFPRGDPACGR